MVKVFEISGKLLVYEDQTHPEFIENFYAMLKENDMFIFMESKDITNQYLKENKLKKEN
jgi:hypothetical protein